jgi:hypothetical protein
MHRGASLLRQVTVTSLPLQSQNKIVSVTALPLQRHKHCTCYLVIVNNAKSYLELLVLSKTCYLGTSNENE